MKLFCALIGFFAVLQSCPDMAAAANHPNVLFIAVDDLNDWVGFLGGHPQVKTPNFDRLARRGVVFTNAHCAAPLCNPSRAAVFSGRHPFQTGVYANDDTDVRKVQPDLALIPQHFKQSGYTIFGTGKLLHQKGTGMYDEEFFPESRWSPFSPEQVSYTPEELPSKGTENPRHVAELKGSTIVLPLNRMPSDRAPLTKGAESFDWGPLDVEDSDMGDGQIAQWAVERIRRAHEKPIFLGVGFYRPHIPLFAPKKYFNLYEDTKIELPAVKDGDLDDLSDTGRKWAIEPVTAGAHANVIKHGQWEAAVRAYLACISFVDAQIGKMLDALDSGPNADNTLIVLWSDHGWHLGEKQHWGKLTGWQRATHVVLTLSPPRNSGLVAAPTQSVCAAPVSLLDLYPTLVELCGLPPREGLAGTSLAPFLSDPGRASDRVVTTTIDRGNYALTGSRWRFIHYADGSEELYDTQADPNEWRNLAGDSNFADVLTKFRNQLPKEEISVPAPPEKKKRKK